MWTGVYFYGDTDLPVDREKRLILHLLSPTKDRPIKTSRFDSVDGQIFKKKLIFLFLNVSWSPVRIRRTAQSALHVMLLSYYIGICVFRKRQCDICRRRVYSQGFAKAVHMSYDSQHFDPA